MFEPGLRLSAPFPLNPCIDIAADVISDRFKEKRDVVKMGPRPPKQHGLHPREAADLGVADKLCTIDFYHDFNFIF